MYRISQLLYPILPTVVPLFEDVLPKRWIDWAGTVGGSPPAAVLEENPHYEALTYAHRSRSRVLQERAFKVTPQTLSQYIAQDLIIDKAEANRWLHSERGAIFASPHYGPFLAAAVFMAAEGSSERPAHVFYDPSNAVPENQRFDTFFQRFSDTLNVLHNQPADLIKAGRALKKKQCISIMFDVVQRPADCMFLPFFDRLYPAMGGAAYLALLTGTPVIPTYTLPAEDRKVQIIFGTPLLPEDFQGEDREQNVFAMTCALFQDLEDQLRQAPWHWIYWGNVSKTSPYDDAMVHDQASLTDEIRRRLHASPQLVKAAPALGSLLQTP